jgi:hypothetical protein
VKIISKMIFNQLKFFYIVAGTGFEPVISRLWALRVNQLLHPAMFIFSSRYKIRTYILSLKGDLSFLNLKLFSPNFKFKFHLDEPTELFYTNI